jgi:hypothetical protein
MLYLPSPWSKTHSPPPIFNWVFLIVTSTTFRSTFSWITSWPLDLVMIYFSTHRSDFNFQKERWDANPIAGHRYVQRYECLMSSSKRYYCPPLTLNRRQRHPICSKVWIFLLAVPAACLEVSPPLVLRFE